MTNEDLQAKVTEALEALVDTADPDTLLVLARRYVDPDVTQDGPDCFIVGDVEAVGADELDADCLEEYTAEELGAEIMSCAESYINDQYELPTMAKLYL